MKSALDIAQEATLRPITEIAAAAGIQPDELEPSGQYRGKVRLSMLERLQARPDGKLVIVTAITPTKAGEGKTTTSVALTMGLGKVGKKVMLCLREPSMGPVFGVKGGGTGGGYSQIGPMEDINLHFNGDFHAVTAAHNLLAAALDASIFNGNPLGIDPSSVTWPRTVDMNDRELRYSVVGLGGKAHGVPRENQFVITAASEVMAVFALASDLKDLRQRLGRIVVASTYAGEPVTAEMLKVAGAMTVVMKDAIKPNLVQTLEGQPALVHAGPFGNIAHAANSILADRIALKAADYVVTEAGFASDLGFQKFCDIVCRFGGGDGQRGVRRLPGDLRGDRPRLPPRAPRPGRQRAARPHRRRPPPPRPVAPRRQPTAAPPRTDGRRGGALPFWTPCSPKDLSTGRGAPTGAFVSVRLCRTQPSGARGCIHCGSAAGRDQRPRTRPTWNHPAAGAPQAVAAGGANCPASHVGTPPSSRNSRPASARSRDASGSDSASASEASAGAVPTR